VESCVNLTLGLSLSLLSLVAADVTVGVAPFTVLGLDEERSGELRQRAQTHLERGRRNREILPLDRIDRAIAELELEGDELHACLRDSSCAAGIAQRARADEILLGSAAGLGRTYELRLSLVESERGVIDRELQQTVEGDEEELSLAIESQLDQLLPARPWYRRWWFWTLTATVIAAAAIVTTLLLVLPDDDQRDEYPLP
jgi:hypothetical protein